MYKRVKHFLKFIIPSEYLFKYELVFRFFISLFYKGDKFQCTVCNKELRKFIPLENKDLLCPYCGSISRNRRLWWLLDSEIFKNNLFILDFSPSRSLYRNLRKKYSNDYVSTDLSGDFIADKNYNITNIDCNENTFNLIICYHILEHIDDDKKAMQELFRVLKPNGHCIIQTPFKEGEIYENPLIITDYDRINHFGQKDHVRIYSANGLKERLSICGFKVSIKEFNNEPNNKNGFSQNEIILICEK